MITQPTIIDAVQALSRCRAYPCILAVIREHARRLIGADGVTFVLVDNGECHYIEEDAISPLWKGQRFPAEKCIGGWVTANRAPAIIPDIYVDPRVPHGAYRSTFVKSLCVVPVRSEEPIGTIGAYWATHHAATPEELSVMQALADTASVAWANAGLIADLRAARDAAEVRAAENARLLTERTEQFDRRVRAEGERDRLGEQLRQAQKMNALGRMTGGIAHDFNNVLGVIIGFTDLLREHVSGDADAVAMAAEVLTAAERGRALTGQLLRFGRQQDFAPEPLELNRVISDARTMIRQLTGSGIRLELALGEGLPAVLADPVQLGQVLLNLTANARDAMPAGGVLRLETARADAGGVRLTVADTGTGMSPEARARLFEPFYTTKPPGKGTGLGLGIVADIVTRHNGAITVDSAPGCGTAFHLVLPFAPHSPPLPAPLHA